MVAGEGASDVGGEGFRWVGWWVGWWVGTREVRWMMTPVGRGATVELKGLEMEQGRQFALQQRWSNPSILFHPYGLGFGVWGLGGGWIIRGRRKLRQ